VDALAMDGLGDKGGGGGGMAWDELVRRLTMFSGATGRERDREM
jgi:hypothetical protein